MKTLGFSRNGARCLDQRKGRGSSPEVWAGVCRGSKPSRLQTKQQFPNGRHHLIERTKCSDGKLLGLLVAMVPRVFPSWVNAPRSAVRVLVSKRITKAGFSSLVSSQTSGRGTAEAGDAKTNRSSSALIPLQYSKGIECIVFRALPHRNEYPSFHYSP
jgi:hypothetical protein